jgi:ubiquinone/menaquinone biosynthesis C-methylase UbiE
MAKEFIPAARIKLLTPLFDIGCSIGGFGKKYRQEVVKTLNTDNKKQNTKLRVLDAGCGTGSLAVDLKKENPLLEIIGVDADPQILEYAKKKARNADVQITFQEAFLQELPFPDNHFDSVVSSLVSHHLKTDAKRSAFKELYRVTKKSGLFLLVDFGPPTYKWAPSFSLFTKYFEEGNDNYDGKIPAMLKKAGFKVEQVQHYKHNIEFLKARK